jgi:hypothetical protein
MELRLRFFIQWSRLKDLWHCAACREFSNIKDYSRMTIQHKPDCKFQALKHGENE